MVKLAFIGTHGVGKTTLCYDLGAVLKKRGLHVDLVKEVARLSPLPINRKTSLEAQMWILTTQIAEEIRSAAHHEVVVCDRSVLDNYAYLVFAAGRQRWLEPLVNRWMKTYDLLFKVPISGDPSADGIRDTDAFFMRQIDRLVDELVEERGLPCERLPEGRREEWAEIVRERVVRPPRPGRAPLLTMADPETGGSGRARDPAFLVALAALTLSIAALVTAATRARARRVRGAPGARRAGGGGRRVDRGRCGSSGPPRGPAPRPRARGLLRRRRSRACKDRRASRARSAPSCATGAASSAPGGRRARAGAASGRASLWAVPAGAARARRRRRSAGAGAAEDWLFETDVETWEAERMGRE